MKHILLTLLILISISCNASLVGKWVYWYEVNYTGQKIMQVGKVLSKDKSGTYRILANEGWKMHLSKDKFTVIKEYGTKGI